MDDFINSQLESQRKHTEDYKKELNQDVKEEKPKEISMDEKVDAVLAQQK
jgi:hypothetical protein